MEKCNHAVSFYQPYRSSGYPNQHRRFYLQRSFLVIEALSSSIRPSNFNGDFVALLGETDLSIRIEACTFEFKNVAVMKHASFNVALGVDWLIQHHVRLMAVGNKLDLVLTVVVPKRTSLFVNAGSPVTNSILAPTVGSVIN